MYCPQNEWSLPNWFEAVEPTETLQIGPPQWNIGCVHKMGDTDTTIEFGLRENLQETIDFPIKYGAFRLSCKFPLIQSIEFLYEWSKSTIKFLWPSQTSWTTLIQGGAAWLQVGLHP